ncbi:MAG: ABC transporter permease [Puniceicoccales bacterium]|jgi:putative ABC transport system permease protein|nr:ABC transporter permease [Puniceicoccales bacterium]
MVFFNAFLIALREIRRNLTRAFLTMLGVIIGVSAVITMVTLGDGSTQAVREQISNLGSNLLMLRPGLGFGPRTSSAGVPNFTQEDSTAILEQVPGVADVAPVIRTSMSTIFMQNARATPIIGSTLKYFSINKWTVSDGRFFDETEARSGAAVCVIGSTVRRELFTDGSSPIGAKIRLGNAACEVIGVLRSKGQMGMGDQDDSIIVPLSTLQRRLIGRTSPRDITLISISAVEGESSDALIQDIRSLMRQRRNLQPSQDDNFNVFDTRQIADTLSASTKTMTSLLTAVAAVSLVVGGIGIMNIMLVSVTERTREIGIRMAIGARTKDVLLQFLVEATTLSCIGGLIGVILAAGLCYLLAPIIGAHFIFNLQINLLALLVSAAVGIFFGFTPARRAAMLDPIEALRHE